MRDGDVEGSERSEGDDLGLRVLVGQRQAVVSSNDLKSDAKTLAERAVAMARVAPEDPFVGLADPRCWRRFPDLDLLDPDMPTVDVLEARARGAEAAGARGERREQIGRRSASAGIGGMVLVTSTAFAAPICARATACR